MITTTYDSLIVLPGRAGDILACLPIAYRYARHGRRVGWAVTAQYAPMLDGVSYVDPVITDRWLMDGDLVAEDLADMAGEVLNLRIAGAKPMGAAESSFVLDMWARAGLVDEYHDWPLAIDRRDLRREARLLDRLSLRGETRPVVAMALAGHSSPLECRDALIEALSRRIGSLVRIVVLDGVRAERLYDLLAVLDRSACLVACDSAVLHLSYASGVPTVGLQSDCWGDDWYGSEPRRHWTMAVRYRDVMHRVDEIGSAIEASIR